MRELGCPSEQGTLEGDRSWGSCRRPPSAEPGPEAGRRPLPRPRVAPAPNCGAGANRARFLSAETAGREVSSALPHARPGPSPSPWRVPALCPHPQPGLCPARARTFAPEPRLWEVGGLREVAGAGDRNSPIAPRRLRVDRLGRGFKGHPPPPPTLQTENPFLALSASVSL